MVDPLYLAPAQAVIGDTDEMRARAVADHGPPSANRAFLAIAGHERRVTIARGLRQIGCRVFAVDSVSHLVGELVDAALRSPDESCVVVADMTLPGLSGLSLLAALRDLHWRIPVILLSRESERQGRRRARRLGATAIFVEPVCLSELVALAKLVLDPRTFAAIHTARLRAAERGEFGGEPHEEVLDDERS